MKRLASTTGRSLLTVVVALATACLATGCWAIGPAAIVTRELSRTPAVEGEPTEYFDWGPTRDAPEMAKALARAAKNDETSRASIGGGANGKTGLGKGRFLGVVVSWMPPDAKLSDPNGYAEVLVAPDGRIGAAPDVYTPCGFMFDGSLLGTESPEMTEYKRDAIRLAAGYVGPGVTSGPDGIPRTVKPYVSAYVLEYEWGVVTIAPDLNPAASGMAQEAPKPDGGWFLVRPLTQAERAALDSLDATQSAQVYLTTKDPAETFWLVSPEVRLYSLSDPEIFMHRAATATVDLVEGRPNGIDPEELAFDVQPPGLLNTGSLLFFSRKTPTAPWRLSGEGL